MRNVKGIVEINIDLLDPQPRTGPFFTGHLSREQLPALLLRRGF
jgi:hypothetical protein